jgi:hypothetical protein
MTDDKLIEQFFENARQTDIPDNGFTERVMLQLPERDSQVLSRLWTVFCLVVATVVFFLMHGWEIVSYGLVMLLNNFPALQSYLITLLVSFVVVIVLVIAEMLSRERAHAF